MTTAKMGIRIPNTTRLYEVLVRLHDDVRQNQYPYSAKVLKYGIIRESEMDEASIEDPNASEVTVWRGLKPTEVASRLAGAFTKFIDAERYRTNWIEAGLSEGSWKIFLEMYCMLKADPAVFGSPEYVRDAEMDNLLTLVKIFDEEVFGTPAMKGEGNLKASLKSKWWKECHRMFNEALINKVFYRMELGVPPRYGACHTPEWTPTLKEEIRHMARNWARSPLWEQSQRQGNAGLGVDFTSNNEANVKDFLREYHFNTLYLEGREPSAA